ncbi:MAG: response regulator [Pseudomonadales bacterium]|nr:response regulator [Pseudomonadales bacterium]MCP5185711.1 response regulator [Pseudomonadales bacterium]
MENEAARLLVVDDDPEIRELLEVYLKQQGFDVSVADSGVRMFELLDAGEYDLIVLDLMLPGEHGLSLAGRVKRELNTPIIIVSAQGEDVDRIVGLEVGADDYVSKPFNPRELLARIRAVLRRSAAQAGPGAGKDGGEQRFRFGPYSLDMQTHRLLRGADEVPLTSGEFDLLAVFVRHPNRLLDRDRILDLLTGAERLPFDRSIDVRVTRLRSKIEADPGSPQFIRTIWGKGYMFCPEGSGSV